MLNSLVYNIIFSIQVNGSIQPSALFMCMGIWNYNSPGIMFHLHNAMVPDTTLWIIGICWLEFYSIMPNIETLKFIKKKDGTLETV